MKTVKHIIQKQVFEMRGSSKRPGFEWEQSVADHHRSVIAPGIEECFDALPSTEEHLVIDSIEIDLGVFTHESFAKEARDKLVRLLGERLRECRKRAVAENEERLKEKIKQEEQGIVEEEYKKPVYAESVLSLENAAGEALLHFLERGDLPWWFTGPEKLFDISVLSDHMITRLLQLLRKEKSAMIRAVRHFPDETIFRLLELSARHHAAAKHEWQVFSKIVEQHSPEFPLFRQRFWMERFYVEGTMMNEETITKLFEPFEKKFISAVYELCLEKKTDKPFKAYTLFLEQLITKKENAAEEKLPQVKDKNDQTPDWKKTHAVNEQNTDQDVRRQAEKETTPPGTLTSPSSSTKTKDEELKPPFAKGNPVLEGTMYVEAAGLVLLHPFLMELFSSTGLWKNERWTDQTSPFKAVQLLSFLSFGAEEVPEYRLIFHKILVGLDVKTPLPAEAPLLPEETATCTELLEAVLRHWTALRNTGIDGLREAFLLRNGKLEQTSKGIRLDVERLAQDVLLARLPWGYSTVKLPWLEPLLTVNWI